VENATAPVEPATTAPEPVTARSSEAPAPAAAEGERVEPAPGADDSAGANADGLEAPPAQTTAVATTADTGVDADPALQTAAAQPREPEAPVARAADRPMSAPDEPLPAASSSSDPAAAQPGTSVAGVQALSSNVTSAVLRVLGPKAQAVAQAVLSVMPRTGEPGLGPTVLAIIALTGAGLGLRLLARKRT
jgi:hypothetical protein